MTRFSWRVAARVVACANLVLTQIFAAISIVRVVLELVNGIDLLSGYGDSLVLLFLRTVEFATSFILLKYTREEAETELALKGIRFWFYINLIFWILRITFCLVKLEPSIQIIEIVTRFVSLCVVCGFIMDLKDKIVNSTSTATGRKHNGALDVP